jgi:hypothetical protein
MQSINWITTGFIAGLAIRFWMAHGSISLFLDPLFPTFHHYQPWL